jgi:serine/threonine protein kinase/Flp pilus assembly protein TadD
MRQSACGRIIVGIEGVEYYPLLRHCGIGRSLMRFGRYEVISDIGKGAMGVVYKCRDPQIGRTVAIKTVSLLHSQGFDESELRDRLLKEARAAGVLSHPHIVTIYDVGEEEDSIYIVMEYLEGEALSQLIEADQARSFGEVTAVADQVGGALDYAHRQGIIHRDVKPANIMRLADGRFKLMDFGIARFFESSITQKGLLVGSPVYMSPEQIEDAELTGQADIYALGAVVFEMLTGRRPFSGKNINALMLAKFKNRRPTLAELDPNLPAALEYFFDRAMAVDLSRRFSSAAEFSNELKAALFSRGLPFKFGEGVVPARTTQTARPEPVKAKSRPSDPRMAETVVVSGFESARQEAEEIEEAGELDKPPEAEPEASTQRFGLTTSVIKAYTSGPSRESTKSRSIQSEEESDTGIIRRDVEQELIGRHVKPRPELRELDRQSLLKEIEGLRRRLAESPDDIEAIISLGRLYNKAGRFSEAVVHFRRALKIDYERTEALDAIAEIYEELNLHERALDTWELSEWISNRKVGRLAKENYFVLGKRLEQERLLRGAIEVWEETAVLEPANVEVWRILASYYLKLKDFRKAIWAHRELASHQSGDVVVLRNLAACYQNCGMYADALKYWRKSLEIEGEGPGAKRARQNVESLERYLGSQRRGPS